jgi:hypothetical protein
MPYLWCIDAAQAHTELGAVTHFKRQRIAVGNLIDKAFDGSDVCIGDRGKDEDKEGEKKEGNA